ncbi:MAG TPA: hypothetical protein VGC06_32685 [Actinomycetes bacterium]
MNPATAAIVGATALVFLAAPLFLVAANRRGRLARWDEREAQRLARLRLDRPPPRWLRWIVAVLLAGYVVTAVLLWFKHSQNRWIPLVQLPSLLWPAFWTLGGRWRARLTGRRGDRGDQDVPKT